MKTNKYKFESFKFVHKVRYTTIHGHYVDSVYSLDILAYFLIWLFHGQDKLIEMCEQNEIKTRRVTDSLIAGKYFKRDIRDS